jgi:hypothetical protein
MATPSVEFEVQRLPRYGVAFVPETWGRENITDKSDPFELTGGALFGLGVQRDRVGNRS